MVVTIAKYIVHGINLLSFLKKMILDQDITLKILNLLILFSWSKAEFLKKTEGSPIRRAGYECWLRNIAIALGNANKTKKIIDALNSRKHFPSALVREHVNWGLKSTFRVNKNID